MYALTVTLKETKENTLKSFEEKIKADEEQILQLTSGHQEKQAEINNLKVKSEASLSICIMINADIPTCMV